MCPGPSTGCVAAFQSVAKANFLRNDQTKRCVINLEISRKGRQTNPLSRRIASSVGNDRFNVHRRCHRIRN